MNADNQSRAMQARILSILQMRKNPSYSLTCAPGKLVLLIYLIHMSIILFSLSLADSLPTRPPSGFINESLASHIYLNCLIKWDAHWYTYIAEYGYDSQSVVFFPALIFCIKILSYLGFNYAFAGLLLCNTFALLSFGIMYLTFRLDFPEQVVRRALLAYAVMPTSFFLNSIYTESMFLFLSLACVYNSRKGNWLIAGFCGAAAALTRNLGVLLFIYLLFESARNEKTYYSKLTACICPCFPPLALLCYMLYTYSITGDLLAFFHSQQGWGRFLNFPLDSILNNIPLLFNGNPYIQPGATLDTFMVLLSVIGLSSLTFSSRFKRPASYLVIGWLWLLGPLMSSSSWLPLYSFSRFALVIFPLYIFLGQLNTRLYYFIILIFAVTLSYCTALFINWHWIG